MSRRSCREKSYKKLFARYNQLMVLHRNAMFSDVAYRQEKAAILKTFGQPFNIYNCQSGVKPAPLPDSEALCKADAEEVYAFHPCYLTMLCPSWYSVAFNNAGQVVNKYHSVSAYGLIN